MIIDMPEIVLAPCACGGKAEVKRNQTTLVQCTECGLTAFQKGHDLDSAINTWNKSHQRPPRIMPSVQPEWCLNLPIQQQSVLLLAARGPDGIAKAHPCKDIHRAYRASVLIAARYGRSLTLGENADSFMSLHLMRDPVTWHSAVTAFFEHADDLPHHYYMHLIHGAEILGYKHPCRNIRAYWHQFYTRCVAELHMNFETEEQMDARLSDWDRKHWDEVIDIKFENCSEHHPVVTVTDWQGNE